MNRYRFKTVLLMQSGIALPTAMVFLIVISVVGLASMQGTRLNQIMTTKMQDLNHAFNYAESGIANGLKNDDLLTTGNPVISSLCDGGCTTGSNPGNAEVTNRYLYTGNTPPPNFSLESGFARHFFQVDSEGKSNKSVSTHLQGLSLIGPSGQE